MRIRNKVRVVNGKVLVKCCVCNKYLPEANFYTRKSRKYDAACKACKRKLSNEYYWKKIGRSKDGDDVIIVPKKEVDERLVQIILHKQKR